MTRVERRPVQFFSDDYLELGRAMSPAEVLEFLESFRLLHEDTRTTSRLISIKIMENLLDAFRAKCRLEGVRYQTQIKRLMSDWLRPETEPGQDDSRIP